ncbi:MAG: hypothetical protein NTY43_09115 [Bacteroidetes bacterium]|nr:hypothetical protein [Bacteroidota bacterium]
MSRPFKFQNIFKLLIAILFLYSCTPTAPTPPTPPVPTVIKPVVTFSLSTITSGIDTIKSTYVVVRGFIADTGRAPITDHGFIVSTDTANLISGQSSTSSNVIKVSLGPLRGGGGFIAKISGLTARSKYSIASFATNNAGTGYSTDSLKNPVDIKFTTKLAIGDSYGGGIVAYLMLPGDTTYDANLQHGLIAATSDQSTTEWTNANASNVVFCGALWDKLLTGKANTDSIIKYNPSPIITSASIARAHRGGNYTDWYLPNMRELNNLVLNYSLIGGFTNNAGYWSSCEVDASTTNKFLAQGRYFYSGDAFKIIKSQRSFVRAIRAF